MTTILVVEDDPRSADLAELILNSKGYKTLIAEDGPQALEMVRENMPDLVILDLMLPGVDGFEVLEKIRSHPQTSDLPVVIVSARTQDNDKKNAAELGVDAYLTKPFRKAKLLKLVETLLHQGWEENPNELA
jgi:CheY-like chemotaxis protein